MRLFKEEDESQLENYGDIRVIQVKMVDRLHNVRTLQYQPLEKQHKVAQETLDFYVPLGGKNHVQLCKEIKVLCEAVLKRKNID